MPSDCPGQPYPVPADLDDERFRWLFGYWRDRHRDGRLPARSGIDPIDFPHLLGRIYLVEVVRRDGRLRFRFRLWGSRIRGIFGHDHTGCWLEDIAAPGTLADIEHALRSCTVERRPHFWRRPMMIESNEYAATRRLVLPLASDGETVDMLIGLIIEERLEPLGPG
ncbi:hypothetical protein GCM10017083_17500 [Thalassobaculum fulvum]|uniref:PAS domain-containing protein n=1 Tax=Thalassobaculum fulvum TaxID=1633335 RepID=A0A918XQK7_9PROT|nr:PAS domain-containing protein [Thalassobaculum fulvum]GHD47291.1 hypothetical protein GCM10017083_17500 [Thalassobaculum fulvum]